MITTAALALLVLLCVTSPGLDKDDVVRITTNLVQIDAAPPPMDRLRNR